MRYQHPSRSLRVIVLFMALMAGLLPIYLVSAEQPENPNEPMNDQRPWLVVINILKRWHPTVTSASSDAVVTVSIANTVLTFTCPFDPNNPFVSCGSSQIEVPALPQTYDVSEVPPPEAVPWSGVGNFNFLSNSQCSNFPEGAPYQGACVVMHTVLNVARSFGEERSSVIVFKYWADDDPNQPPAPTDTDVIVTIDGVPTTLTCPAQSGQCGVLTHQGSLATITVTEPNPPQGWVFSGTQDFSQWFCPPFPPSRCRALAVVNTRETVLSVSVRKEWVGDNPPNQPVDVTVQVGNSTEVVSCPGAVDQENCGFVTFPNFPGFADAPLVVTEGTLPPGWYQVFGNGTWDGTGQLPPGWECTGTLCTVTVRNGRTSLEVVKQWSPPAGNNDTAVLTITFLNGPSGDEQTTVSCSSSGCTPSLITVPAWVSAGTQIAVSEVTATGGYQAVSGIGTFTWGQNSQGWQCNTGQCQLTVRNQRQRSGPIPTPTPTPEPTVTNDQPLPTATPRPQPTVVALHPATPEDPTPTPEATGVNHEQVAAVPSPTVAPTATPATNLTTEARSATPQLLPQTGGAGFGLPWLLLIVCGTLLTLLSGALTRQTR